LLLGDRSSDRLAPPDVLTARLPQMRIVFLAACDTDTGPIYKSEGSATVARAFFAAGVPVVVATLWPVDDDIGAQITRDFYRHLRRGLDPAAALREAQLEAMSRPTGSRTDWAAFRVIGAGIRFSKPPDRQLKRGASHVQNVEDHIQRYLYSCARFPA
jgi:CHAT domain-containing protein